MKNSLKTIMASINGYLEVDRASRMTPITPMHMAVSALEEELRERLTASLKEAEDDRAKHKLDRNWEEDEVEAYGVSIGQIRLCREILGETKK